MAKYDSNTKLVRNQALFDYKEAHPELSWKEIGEIFNITRERAHTIYHNHKKRLQIAK